MIEIGQVCTYVGKDRTIDNPSTKHFRAKLRTRRLTVIDHDGGFAQCRDELGAYYSFIPLRDLVSVFVQAPLSISTLSKQKQSAGRSKPTDPTWNQASF